MRPRADTLLFWAGAACTYGCRTCPIDPSSAPDAADIAELHRQLVALPDRGGRLVLLVGGEPFLRKDILRYVATIRGNGSTPGIVTTGLALGYPQVRERLRSSGLAYLRLQLFGTGEDHDRNSGVEGAFDLVLGGVRSWLEEADGVCDLDVAINVRGRRPESLKAEVERIAEALDSSVQIVVAADGVADWDRFSEVVRELDGWNDDPGRPLVAWEGLREAGSPAACMTVPRLLPNFVATAPRSCCLGDFSSLGMDAQQSAQSNSFNFVRTGVVVPFVDSSEACRAHEASRDEASREGASDREMWLVEGDELAQYATDTGDFDAEAVARIKDQWSHVFVDRAAAGVLDDFREGMRRVIPDSTCRDCTERGHCGRRFRVVGGQPFAREEAWIADYVRRLRGRVLDVGCGEQLYRDEIVPLVRSGTVHYTGLDPDEPSLSDWRKILPEGDYFQGGVEDFRVEAAAYDRILCLRSLNHVFDLDEAIGRMAEMLKPGGELLIVETTPFAMLRRPEQVAAADAAPRAGHQHFRNATSEDVLPYTRRRSLQVLTHHAVGFRTTNEWILLLKRPEAR